MKAFLAASLVLSLAAVIAFSSAVEVLNQIIIAHELGLINQRDYQALREQIESITNKLYTLRNYQINK